jgi:hypothetical protein
MHFLYIDEAGNTGTDLTAKQQPVFVMASLVVSDEKWRKTTTAIKTTLETYFGQTLQPGFELHAHQLLSPCGEGPFADHDRTKRNTLALDLLKLIEQRGHYLFHVPIYKATLAQIQSNENEFGFDWHHPWQFAFSLQVTMFEEFLRGPSTGSTSSGLIIIDHQDDCVEFVRTHTAARQKSNGWKELKKVVEIGYSAVSHANSLIQLTDVAAFTLKKFYELETELSTNWCQEAKDFFKECKNTIWPRVKFKNPSFSILKVHASVLDHAKEIRR